MWNKILKDTLNNIIQVSTSSVENNQSTQCNYIVTALCSDGTLWEKRDGRENWECIN